jgi:HNH endonuclease/NUMOD3 motif
VIDHKDFIKINGRKKIRCYCSQCGRDKGYLWNKKLTDRPCKDCRSLNISKKLIGSTPWNKGKSQTLEVKQKLRLANLGKQSPTKGIKLPLERRIKIHCSVKNIKEEHFTGFSLKENRQLFKDLALSKKTFERDNYICQKCFIYGVALHAHHKNSWAHFVDQRYDIKNLITLCNKCHKLFHRVYGNGTKLPNTEDQMIEFLKGDINGK